MSLGSVPTALLLPPINLMLGAVVGWALLRRRPRFARWLIGVCLLAMFVLSIPVVPRMLLYSLEMGLPGGDPVLQAGVEPGAVVILSGELNHAEPAGGVLPGDDVGPLTLERMRAGVVLARRTGLPLLVTGGVLRPDTLPIAVLMARDIKAYDSMPVRWVEPRSLDTWQNADYSAALLAKAGVTRVYLVTHAWHMRRSLIAFENFGITAISAPPSLNGWPKMEVDYFVPSVTAWLDSTFALHEWIGCVVYALRVRFG